MVITIIDGIVFPSMIGGVWTRCPVLDCTVVAWIQAKDVYRLKGFPNTILLRNSMNIAETFDNEKWNEFLKKMERYSRSRLWRLRSSDWDADDAVNSAVRSFWDRLHNGDSRKEDRRDPVPETEEDVLALLFKHLRRKIHASYKDEKKKSSRFLRGGDVNAKVADVFYDQFVSTGELSDSDLDLFFKAALQPISEFSDEAQQLATLLLQGYTPKEISELVEKPLHSVYAAIVELRKRVKNLEL